MKQSIWDEIEAVDQLKRQVDGWEATGDMEGSVATYRAENGRMHFENPRTSYYLGLKELRQVYHIDEARS